MGCNNEVYEKSYRVTPSHKSSSKAYSIYAGSFKGYCQGYNLGFVVLQTLWVLNPQPITICCFGCQEWYIRPEIESFRKLPYSTVYLNPKPLNRKIQKTPKFNHTHLHARLVGLSCKGPSLCLPLQCKARFRRPGLSKESQVSFRISEGFRVYGLGFTVVVPNSHSPRREFWK